MTHISFHLYGVTRQHFSAPPPAGLVVARDRTPSRDSTTAAAISREALELESHTPANGVVFSDCIEQDFLNFNSGAIAHVGIASVSAQLVVHPPVPRSRRAITAGRRSARQRD